MKGCLRACAVLLGSIFLFSLGFWFAGHTHPRHIPTPDECYAMEIRKKDLNFVSIILAHMLQYSSKFCLVLTRKDEWKTANAIEGDNWKHIELIESSGNHPDYGKGDLEDYIEVKGADVEGSGSGISPSGHTKEEDEFIDGKMKALFEELSRDSTRYSTETEEEEEGSGELAATTESGFYFHGDNKAQNRVGRPRI